jgi:DNA-binding NarL/FixJ family response regulator
VRSTSDISVLVVDDQPVYHQIVLGLLDRDPEVTVVGVASTIDQALEKVRAHKPTVVLMDQVLPDGHGTDAARQITKGFRHPRVIMLTASADEATIRAARKAGCSGYVTKDRVVHDLLAAVKGAHRGRREVPTDSLSVYFDVHTDDGPQG